MKKFQFTKVNKPFIGHAVTGGSKINTDPNHTQKLTDDVKAEDELKAEDGKAREAATAADDDDDDSAREGGDEDELGKPVLQLTKKQQELFPFLSAIRDAIQCCRSRKRQLCKE